MGICIVPPTTNDDTGDASSVSVIIPCFNRAHLIGRALASIVNQIRKPLEVIVVDDCSTDNIAEQLALYSNIIPLRCFRSCQNFGGGHARNVGIRNATGHYVAFLDSDDEWAPDHLSALIDAAEHVEGNFIIASSSFEAGNASRTLPGKECPHSLSIGEKMHFVLSNALAFQTSTLFMPRRTARAFMFDHRLRRHQDWDLAFRMIEQEATMRLLRNATAVYHAPGASNLSRSRSITPSLRFMVKHRRFMLYKSVMRFITLEIIRRKSSTIILVAFLIFTSLLGGISFKELLYYVANAFFDGKNRRD